VPAITLAQLRAFHAKAYAAGNAVIAGGRPVPRRSRGHRRPGIRRLPKARPWRKSPSRPNQSQPDHIEFPSKQTHLMLAQLGIDRDDPDYAALSWATRSSAAAASAPA
jgi:zinc protease